MKKHLFRKPSALDLEIANVESDLLDLYKLKKYWEPANERDEKDLLEKLDALMQLKGKLKTDRPKGSIDKTQVIVAGIGLIGIWMILNFERDGIVSSKGLGIATKLMGK